MNNFHVHQKLVWSLEGHHLFQDIMGHFDWNPNCGSTSQRHNSFIFYDFEVGSNELERLRRLLQMLCWIKFQNLKGNTCDNARHYRSFWTKCIERQKSPTSSAHNSFIKIQMMKNLSPFWLFWRYLQLWCWRFFHLKFASTKHRGLNIGQI